MGSSHYWTFDAEIHLLDLLHPTHLVSTRNQNQIIKGFCYELGRVLPEEYS
jgi:hypothetical protein